MKESVDGVVVDGVVVKLSCVASALLSDNGKDVNLSVPIVRKHVMEDMPSSGFKASTMAAQPEVCLRSFRRAVGGRVAHGPDRVVLCGS